MSAALKKLMMAQANEADMYGYGLSGGVLADPVQIAYQQQLMQAVAGPKGAGLSGGKMKPAMSKRAAQLKAMFMSGKMNGGIASGGMVSGGANNVESAIYALENLRKDMAGVKGGYAKKTKRCVKARGGGLSGGLASGGGLSGGCSGPVGYSLDQGYPARYPGSIPMPGFSPPPEGFEAKYSPARGAGLSGGMVSGGLGSGGGLSGGCNEDGEYLAAAGLSGGKAKFFEPRVPGQIGRSRRVRLRKYAPRKPSAWQLKLKDYMAKHPGSTMKTAMIALKGTK